MPRNANRGIAHRRSIVPRVLVLLLAAIAGPLFLLQAADPPAKPANDETPPAAAGAKIEPKQLAAETVHGIEYLVGQQHADGGWGQGGGWRQSVKGGGRVEGAAVEDPSDMADTCIAALVLIRAGNTTKEGKHSPNLVKALDFIYKHVEDADKESLYVTNTRDTQLQSKIGTYVDTFLAALVLSELKGQKPDAGDARLLAALDKTIHKIERNQKEDGTFAGNHGWASTLSQGLCGKALNKAAQSGAMVSKEALARDFRGAQAELALTVAKPTGKSLGAGLAKRVEGKASVVAGEAAKAAAPATTDAGVAIYGQSANVGRIQQQSITNIQDAKKARAVLESKTTTSKQKDEARSELKAIAEVSKANEAAVGDIVKRLDDKQFLAGFGNNGGEEFLSYMTISETVRVKGGPEWLSWDKSISQNLAHVQNKDGSWSGDHCITGRTFCTAAALLTLMADRAPLPPAADESPAKPSDESAKPQDESAKPKDESAKPQDKPADPAK